MEGRISPKFKLELLEKIEGELWDQFQSYKKVKMYVSQWQEGMDWNTYNFPIVTKGDTDDIDLTQTLSNIDDETVMQIAVDLGISTPDFIPVVSEIENIFKSNFNTSKETFQKALSQCYKNPDSAVVLANSALESIIKHILDDKVFADLDRNKTLYALTVTILKEFNMFPPKGMPTQIRNISTSLLKVAQSVENLRSNNTDSHGKLADDYVIKDSIYAFFVVNTVATVGLFLIGFYEKKFKKPYSQTESEEVVMGDIPF
jgi:hypothetical protein